MGNKKRKVLILGADGYSRTRDDVRVECFTWDKLSRIENLRDYDALLLNLIPLEDEALRAKVDWKKFHSLLDFCAASDILMHEGTIVVLGDPRFDIPSPTGSDEIEFLDWTGASFTWDSQPGDTIKVTSSSDAFSGYLRHFHRWTYSLERCQLNVSVFATRWNTLNAILANRSGSPHMSSPVKRRSIKEFYRSKGLFRGAFLSLSRQRSNAKKLVSA